MNMFFAKFTCLGRSERSKIKDFSKKKRKQKVEFFFKERYNTVEILL